MKQYRRLLRSLTKSQNLCWITVSFLISHFVILQQAHTYCDQVSGQSLRLEKLALWDPSPVIEMASVLSEEVRSMHTTVALTAGLMDTLLIGLTALAWLLYLQLKFEPKRGTLKWAVALPAAMFGMYLLRLLCSIWLLSTEGPIDQFWTIPLCIVAVLQGISICATAIYAIAISISSLRLRHLIRRVNTN